MQARRQYNKKAVEILKKVGFTGANVDPYIYIKKSMKGIVYIVLYVDNDLMIGNMR